MEGYSVYDEWIHLLDFSVTFDKGDNFCDFLFTFLYTSSPESVSISLEGNSFPLSGAN